MPSIPQNGLPDEIGSTGNNGGPASRGATALNKRLLSQLAQQPPDTDLPLGAGEIIEIAVLEVDALSKLRARIPLRGAITLPLLGPLVAANRTTIELEDDICQRLRQKFMHDRQVSVGLEEQKSQRISVVGAVNHGGVFTMSSRLRLADLLALAGGLTSDADHRVYVIRHRAADRTAQASPQAEVPRVKTSVAG